jgi:hypothetical protein
MVHILPGWFKTGCHTTRPSRTRRQWGVTLNATCHPLPPCPCHTKHLVRLGTAYRFEACTPAPKRVRGYYAMPLLWRDRVIGWGNLAVWEGALQADMATWPSARASAPSARR